MYMYSTAHSQLDKGASTCKAIQIDKNCVLKAHTTVHTCTCTSKDLKLNMHTCTPYCLQMLTALQVLLVLNHFQWLG